MQARSVVVNLQPRTSIPVIKVNQYDVGVPLSFVIYDGNVPASFGSGTTVTFEMTRPSGVGVVTSCSIAGNIVSKSTTLDMTREAGDITAELRFASGSTDVGTCNFTFVVEEAAHPDGTIDADTEALEAIAQQVHADTVQSTNNATTASSAAASATTSANIANQNAETAVAAARSAALANQSAQEAKLATSTDAATASSSASTAASAANTATAQATLAAQSANTANTKASQAESSANSASASATAATNAKNAAVDAKDAAISAKDTAVQASTDAQAAQTAAEAAAEAAIEAAESLEIDDTLTQTGQAADAKKTGDEISGLKESLEQSDIYQMLLCDNVPDTTQTYTFSDGTVSQVTHSRNETAVRTDAFTYGTSTITEVRTLNTGESLTIATNLTTLDTTVTYAAA